MSNQIKSDDPNAITKLQEKLEKLQKSQETMKSVNRIIRSKNPEYTKRIELQEKFGYTEAEVNSLFTPSFGGQLGYPSYHLTNNNGNMRNIKERIAHLERIADDVTSEQTINGIQITDNVEDNRVQVFFPGKPEYEVRSKLKGNGFRWSRYNGCWQSYRGQHYINRAKAIIEQFYGEQGDSDTSGHIQAEMDAGSDRFCQMNNI